jgi:hypothetical protein
VWYILFCGDGVPHERGGPNASTPKKNELLATMSPESTMSRQQLDSLAVGDAIIVRIRGVETAAELLTKQGNRLRVKLVAAGKNSWCASDRPPAKTVPTRPFSL